MIGETLDGTYTIVALLGSGAMGEVFEARHVTTGRRVAIKILRGLLAQESSLVTRFHREARASGTIASRHIAEVLDAGTDEAKNAPYLVMELLVGEDLDALVKRLGALRPGLALRIVAQALAGLDRAHAANVIHRDIKPANLFLAKSADPGAEVFRSAQRVGSRLEDGGVGGGAADVETSGVRTVKIVDFGIAKVKDDLAASQDAALTQTSALLGSPLYMSPEQAKASKHVDARADLWSIATVLHQLLTGRAPHGGCESLTELLLAICTQVAPPVQDSAPWVSPDIAAIVTRALDMNIERRFSSAAEMLSAIATLEPDWQTIDEAMLTPMTADEKAALAPRAVITSSVSVSPGAETIAEPRSAAVVATPPPGSGTENAYIRDGDGRARKTTNRTVVVAAGALATVAAIALGWRAFVAHPATPPSRAEPAVAAAPPLEHEVDASVITKAEDADASLVAVVAPANSVAITKASASATVATKPSSAPKKPAASGAPRTSAPHVGTQGPAPSAGISRDFN